MATHDIDFVNPTFHSGLNITVRHGDKWVRQANIGDRLAIAGHDGPITATLTGMMAAMADEIPTGILGLEHDPDARDTTGLKRILDDIYGPTADGRRAVTVLFFTVD